MGRNGERCGKVEMWGKGIVYSVYGFGGEINFPGREKNDVKDISTFRHGMGLIPQSNTESQNHKFVWTDANSTYTIKPNL